MPEVSVVMSVYNSADSLEQTLESVLSQEGVDLEFIVIDDGSTDATAEILDEATARDGRLRVIHQGNVGLTRSLIRGCEMACGEFIARQDAGGDVSLAGRLQDQARSLRDNPEATLVSCGARFLGPKAELLYDISPGQRDLTHELRVLDLESVRGPAHHGSTMFRKADYLRVGGYRPQFAVAQDLDLWLRLVERGVHISIPEIAYQAVVTPHSISQRKRPQQIKTTKIILECARCRRDGLSEQYWLGRAASLPGVTSGSENRFSKSTSLYFIGSCLETQSPGAAREYYRRSVKQFPLNLKSWWRLLSSLGLP